MTAGDRRRAERRLVARLGRRLPRRLLVHPRVERLLRERYLTAGATGEARMRLGHRLLLDLRARAQRQAYFTGWFDDGLIRFARGLLRPGSVALDIGANVGLWTVPLAARARDVDAEIVAFEPVPANQERLHDNLRRNGLAAAAGVVPLALSDAERTGALTLREDFQQGSATGNAALRSARDTEEPFRSIPARTVRLDDHLDPRTAARVAVAKLDVEGHEHRVLRGAAETLGRARPVLITEWNTVYYERRGLDAAVELGAALHGLDYTTLRYAGGRWRAQPRVTSPHRFDHLVIVPSERTDELAAGLPGGGPAA